MTAEFLYKDYIKAKIKSGVNVDTGFRCRLQCPACYRTSPASNSKIKASKDISLDSWGKILAMPSKTVQLCGQISDPIYHPKFHEMLSLRNEEYSDMVLRIYTNGSGKKAEWWDKVIELSAGKSDQWVFGLDGTDQESANTYRVGTDFDDVWQVMCRMAKSGITVIWQFIVFEYNKHQLPLAYKMAEDNGIMFKELWTSRDTAEVPAAKQKEDSIQTLIYRY